MYSRWLNWNHRLRLTTLLTATVSVALAAVFLLVVLFVREQAQGRRFDELERSVTRISKEWESPDSLREVNEDFPGVEVAVYTKTGALISSTTKKTPPLVKGRSRSADVLVYGIPLGTNVFVGVSSWTETEAGLEQLSLVLAALWLPLTLLTAAVSWYGGGLVLRPVRELVASATMLSGTTQGETLSTTDRAEFASLADSLNQLIERVRHSASLQEQFASDAAHELRTPLALMQSRVETNLKRPRSFDEHIASQKAVLKHVERLTSIVEALLISARQLDPSPTLLDFGEAVQVAAQEWAELREWPSAQLRLEIGSCPVHISREETGIILCNLLDNGANHSRDNARLEVSVKREGHAVLLIVRDFGDGLTAEEMTHAFERFYRSCEGRSRRDGGAGIGLAVVKKIVESRGGHCHFIPVEKGALMQVTLPCFGTLTNNLL